MSANPSNAERKEDKKKPKKPKLSKVQVLAIAADLLHASKYNTFTERSFKEYNEIERELRIILREFRSLQKEQGKAATPQKVKYEAPRAPTSEQQPLPAKDPKAT